ncbi:MAG: hypothetical protein RLZZ116_503 [Planctomycetota bacterium]
MSKHETDLIKSDSPDRIREAVNDLAARLDETQRLLEASRMGLARLLATMNPEALGSGGLGAGEERGLQGRYLRIDSAQSWRDRWSSVLTPTGVLLPNRFTEALPDSPVGGDHEQSDFGLEPNEEILLLHWCDGRVLSREDRNRVQELLRSNPGARRLCEIAMPSITPSAPTGSDWATRLFEVSFRAKDSSSVSSSASLPRDLVGPDSPSRASRAVAVADPDQVAASKSAERVSSSDGEGKIDAGTYGGLADELEGALRDSMRRSREPVLVLGSGILHQCAYGPYADWTVLLQEVARRYSLTFDEAFAREHPTAYWESMIVQAAKRDGLQANQIESRLLRSLSELLQGRDEAASAGSFASLRASGSFRSIVVLNFTAAPILDTITSSAPEETEPFPSFSGAKCRVWCPHGHHRIPASMRLGARKYSQLMTDLEIWRAEYHHARGSNPSMSRSDDVRAGVRFIADVLESPLVFAGCGLRAAEWTIWWLLATKARNEARHLTCPSVFVTADELPPAQHSALQGLNCRVLKTRDHAEVWAFVNRVACVKSGGHS